MAGIVRKRSRLRNREPRTMPVIQVIGTTPPEPVVPYSCYASLACRLKQAQLLAVPLRPGKVVRRQLRAPLVEPEPVAGDLEAAADGPGHRTRALHPPAPFRVVVAPASHGADPREDVAVAVRIVRQQPV